MSLIKLENLTFSYYGCAKPVFDGIEVNIREIANRTVCIPGKMNF